MNLIIQDFAALVRERVTNATMTRDAIAISIGVSVGLMLPIPTTAVDHMWSEYDGKYVNTANVIFGKINEEIVFDVVKAAELSRGIWLMRMQGAFPDTVMLHSARAEGGFFDTLFGASSHLAPKDLQYFNENKAVLMVLVNRARGMLKELNLID